MKSVYLKPAEYYFGDQPARITTVLGSCVALSLYYPRSGLAAMCHALASDCGNATSCQKKCANRYRYVSCMIPAMIHSFYSRGIKPEDIEAKLFGGAAMLDADSSRISRGVGALNVKAVQEILRKNNLKIKASDIGGRFGRKIIFDTRTGEVLLKRLHPANWRSQAVTNRCDNHILVNR